MNRNAPKMVDYDPNEGNNQSSTKQKTEQNKNKEAPDVNENSQPSVSSPVAKDNSIDSNSVFGSINGLPTGGKLYPDGTKIEGRPLKVQEIKMLSQMTEENANDIVNTILERAITGIEIDNIYSADKLFIMFWLRANTYQESGYNVKFECGKCDSLSEFEFELDQLKIKKLDDEKEEFLTKPFKLPNGDKLTFSLLTVGDEREVQKFLEDNKNSMMQFDDDIVNICKMIGTVNGKKMGMISCYRYLTDELDAPNYMYLESYLEDKSAGLEPLITVKCEKCGGASETMLPFRPDFFLPKVRL